MGYQTACAVFNSLLGIGEIAAASISQCIQWAIAEQAAEMFRIAGFMAGKVLTFLILKEIIMGHILTSGYLEKLPTAGKAADSW